MRKFKSLKWYWKALIIFAVVFSIVVVSANYITAYLADKQLNKIKEQFAGRFDFSYDNLTVRLLQKEVVLKNFRFFSVVDSTFEKDKIDFQLDKLFLDLDSYSELAISGKLVLKKVGIYNPTVVYGLKRLNKKTGESEIEPPDSNRVDKKDLFLKYLHIDEFVLENAKADVYRLIKPDKKILYIDDLDIHATGISVDFTTDSLFASSSIETLIYDASDIINNDLKYHELAVGNIHYDISTRGFEISKFHIKNKQSRDAYNKSRTYRSPWLAIDVEKIHFDIFPWEVYQNGIFDLGKIVLTEPDIVLYVDLNLPLSPKIKPMPSKMIRDIPVQFNLDSLQLIDASFVFMPKMKGENPGNVELAPINGYLTHITNVPENLVEDPNMKLDIDCKIWDEGIVDIYMEIDVPDKNDPMYVKGQVEDLNLKQVENMIKNLFGIEVMSGYLKLLKFEYIADDVTSNGKVVFNYHDLALDLKKKAGKIKETNENIYKDKSNKLLNFFAKGAIRKDNMPGYGKYKPIGYIHRERIRDKAFSDALWGSIEVGIFDVAIKDAFFNSKKKYNKKEKKKLRKEEQAAREAENEKKNADQALDTESKSSTKSGKKNKNKKKKKKDKK